MRMPGSICAYCLFYYGVNRYILYKKKIDLVYVFLGFLPIIIMGFRSLIAATVFFTVVMIPFITKSITKTFIWLIVGCVILIGISRLGIVQTKINEMLERQESGQTFTNEDYIRFLEYEYFNETIFVKSGERFFGGGVPADETSLYYQRFLTHLKYFAQRYLHKELQYNEDERLFNIIKEQYREAYGCVKVIYIMMEEKYQYALSKEEMMYLSIHIQTNVEKSRHLLNK